MIGLLLLAWLGCGVRSADPLPTDAAVFPHPDGYPAHGLDWRRDSGSCLTCHDALGGSPSAGPACTSCHPAYPHLPDMHAGAVHGDAWTEDPAACVVCHGDGRQVVAGAPGSACVGCHATYPHPAGWSHGEAVRQRGGEAACVTCHAAPDACSTCHAGYPHPPGWAAPEQHGASSAGCGVCHGPPAPDGTPACSSCHDTYPHPAGWAAFGHLPVVQARGEGGCLGCHGATSGPRIPQGCAPSCHGGQP